MMAPLDRKMLRDLARMWAQALAIAMVIAGGVATLVLAVGSSRSLEETRQAYYERYRFGHVFASATRAPSRLARTIAAIPGVSAVETRVMKPVLLDVAGVAEPVTGMAASLPDHRMTTVNRLYLRTGRLPEPGRPGEVVVNADFAAAHRLTTGDRLAATINGTRESLRIVGIALSPEFIYAIGPGDLVPDSRRFAVLYFSERTLAALFDLEGAFNSVSLRLLNGAPQDRVIDRLDALLGDYGGTGAYGRKDQISNAFLDGELKQLAAMARVIPPIFLLVSAFLINMVLTRLIALEREQIGLLKALGYGRAAIAAHYLKLASLIALVGIGIGSAAGTWLGDGMTRLFGEFYSFPFLLFRRSPDLYGIAAAVALGAALGGGLRAVARAVAMPPAVAMQPPAPARYRRLLSERLGLLKPFSRLTVMALRQLVRRPVQTAFSALGTSLAVAVLVTALFSFDSVDFMVDTLYFRSERQDATLNFANERPQRAVDAVARLPGVMQVEGFRHIPVRIRHRHYTRRLTITGKQPQNHLSQVLDLELQPVPLPRSGLVLSERVAQILHARVGDVVEVEVMEGRRRRVKVAVSDVIQSYFGLLVYADLAVAHRIAGDGPRVSGTHIAVDASQIDRLYKVIKSTPAVSGIALLTKSREKFRETIERNIVIMTTVYVVLAVVIAFGMVYNAARIELSERGRELASLRVLGFTRSEVFQVLAVQLAVVVLTAQPLGWLIGYTFAWIVTQGFASDLYRVPLIVESDTFAYSSGVVLAAAAISSAIVRGRINQLDLVAVLKTRE